MTWAGLLFLAQAPSCLAQMSADAKAAYVAADHLGAVRAVDGAEACFDGNNDELAEALRWRGQAQFSAGKSDAALDAFVELASVAPGYALDPMLSPKLHELFRNARVRALKGDRVFAMLKQSRAPATVRIDVFGPPAAYDAVALELLSRERVSASRTGGERWAAPRPRASTIVRVVLTRGGQQVYRGPPVALPEAETEEAETTPAPAAAVSVAPAPAAAPASNRTVWFAVGAGAAAVVIAGVIAGLVVANQRPRESGTLGALDLP